VAAYLFPKEFIFSHETEESLKPYRENGASIEKWSRADDNTRGYNVKQKDGSMVWILVAEYQKTFYEFRFFFPAEGTPEDSRILNNAYFDLKFPEEEATATAAPVAATAPTTAGNTAWPSDPGHCSAISVTGSWYAEPYVDRSVIAGMSYGTVRLEFEFFENGSYSYQANVGSASWVRHTGTYTIANTWGEARRLRYVCELALRPNPSSVRIYPIYPTFGVLPLRTSNLPVDESINYRMQDNAGAISMQKTNYSPSDVGGTWTLRPRN
jgi:hypothetical protein